MESTDKFKEFLEALSLQVNSGIHSDLEASEEHLEKYGIKNYIIHSDDADEIGELDVKAIERDFKSGKLDAAALTSIGFNYAKHGTHKNFHQAIDSVSEAFGIPKLEEADVVKEKSASKRKSTKKYHGMELPDDIAAEVDKVLKRKGFED